MTDTKRFALLILFTVCAATIPTRAFAQGGPYPTEFGTIEYMVEGAQNGTMIRYWRNWGLERAESNDLTLSMFGITQVTQTYSITNAETVTTIDLTDNTATQIQNPASNFYDMSPDQMANVNQSMMQAMGAQLVGTDVILGQECEVWELAAIGGDMCLWSGVELRNAGGAAGVMMSMTATSIDTSALGDEPFTVPAGVTFTTGGPGTGNLPSLDDILNSIGQ